MKNFLGVLVLTLSVSSAFGEQWENRYPGDSIDKLIISDEEICPDCFATQEKLRTINGELLETARDLNNIAKEMAFKFKVKIPRKLEYYKESIKNARDLDKVVNAVFDLLEQTTEKDQELISVASFAGQYRKITGNEPRMEVFTEYVDTETGKYISRKKGEADALLPRELEIKKFEVEALPVAHYRQANITLTAKTAAEHFRTKKASGKLKTR